MHTNIPVGRELIHLIYLLQMLTSLASIKNLIVFSIKFEYHRLNVLNLLSPHDALKHHFTSLETDLILLQQRVSERNFHETNLPIHDNFL